MAGRTIISAFILASVISSTIPGNDGTINKNYNGARIDFDGLRIENNMWGKGGILDYKQIIFLNTNGKDFGWEWSWPENTKTVKSYPEVIFGKKPWDNHSTSILMPVTADKINLSVKLKYSTVASGDYNAAFDIWVTSSQISGPKDIIAEVMIWLENSNMLPMGIIPGKTVEIGGHKYGYFSINHFKGGGGDWKYICFILKDGQKPGLIPIKEFIQYLIGANEINRTNYVSSIEFGNEIMTGNGKTSISMFIVE